jgi:two-component system sensor histidine kinase AlgZ
VLRVLAGVEGLAVVLALAASPDPGDAVSRLLRWSAQLQPALLIALGLLAAFTPRWRDMPPASARREIFAATLGATLGVALIQWLSFPDAVLPRLPWALAFTALATGLVLGYLELRARALSPALAQARLEALQARIRPHFLFNSLNAALSLIRSEPRRAERTLEALADMLRASMRDPGELATLDDELALTRDYLDMESLRLGERLSVRWALEPDLPGAARLPPLLLQPLVENAVYHGIEPSAAPAAIQIGARVLRGELALEVRNPIQPAARVEGGHRMALANIRERLALLYDAEASLQAGVLGDEYVVRITLPLHVGKAMPIFHAP